MDSDTSLREEMRGLKKNDLAGWRALGMKLLAADPPLWSVTKDFLNIYCPKAAADVRGALRHKLVEAANAVSPKRQEERRQKEETRNAFSPKQDERKTIPNWVFKDY
jgi:hypothetical protein